MLRRTMLALGAIPLLSSALATGAAEAQGSTRGPPIAGVYTLAAVYDQTQAGKRHNPWGPDVKGMLILTPSGQFSYQVIGGNRDRNSRQPRIPIGPALTYFGTYALDAGARTLTFHLDRASFPPYDGITRTWRIEGMTDSGISLETNIVHDPTLGDFKGHQVWKRMM